MTYEDDDLVDTVDELRWEVSLDSAHHELSCLRPYRTFTHLVEVRRTKIRRHNDNRVPEVNDTALTVGQTTVIEDLQEELDELAGRFLDFVDEDMYNTVRLAADVFSELPSAVVADVARRSTDGSRDRMLLRILGPVDTNHGIWRVEQDRCELERVRQLRL